MSDFSSLFDFSDVTGEQKTRSNINKLLQQVSTGNLPDDLYLKKVDLLCDYYESLQMYRESDTWSLTSIKDGTSVLQQNGDNKLGLSAAEIVRKGYFRRAKRHFEDYMIACEWYRTPDARFYLPRRKVLEGKHHLISEIDKFLTDDRKFLSLSMPPGTGKSTLIKFLSAYIMGRFPLSMNMYVSYSGGMVNMILDSLEGILTDHGEYAHNIIFPPQHDLRISKEDCTISYRRKGDFPTFGLVSLGGSVTGRTRANTFMITDDLVRNAEQARSRERLEKLNADYKNTLTTRMIGDKVKQIMLGTIWSANDPISVQMNEHSGDPEYSFIAIPVLNEETGESNFMYDHPDRYSVEKIEDIRNSLDPVDFSCLMMQKPMEREGRLFPEEELLTYNGTLPAEPDAVVAFCDVAWGGGDSLSMPIGYIVGEMCFIPDVIFDKGDKKHTKPRVVGALLKHKVNIAEFEANNGGDEYADDVQKMLHDSVGNYSTSITHRKAGSRISKAVRIEQQAPVIKEWYFLDRQHRSKEYGEFMKELCSFNTLINVPHDDAPDSCAGLANLILHNMHRNHATVTKRKF